MNKSILLSTRSDILHISLMLGISMNVLWTVVDLTDKIKMSFLLPEIAFSLVFAGLISSFLVAPSVAKNGTN